MGGNEANKNEYPEKVWKHLHRAMTICFRPFVFSANSRKSNISVELAELTEEYECEYAVDRSSCLPRKNAD